MTRLLFSSLFYTNVIPHNVRRIEGEVLRFKLLYRDGDSFVMIFQWTSSSCNVSKAVVPLVNKIRHNLLYKA